MLGWRVLISTILIPSLIGIFMLDARDGAAARYLLALCVLLTLRGVWELTAMLKARSFAPNFALTAGCAVAVVLAAWYQPLIENNTSGGVGALGPIALVYSLSVLAMFFSGALRYRQPGTSMETLGAEMLTVSYLGVLIAVTAQLRWIEGGQAGYLALGSLVIAAKAGDIGAYTLGRLFGKRKMIPRLSPGKTWMGAVGAVLGSGTAAVAWFTWATPMFSASWQPCVWYVAMLYGVVIGVTGLIGDLCESLIKRDTGHKDSAALMPGFGGLLDLLDSILYAGPVAYLLWQILPLVTL